jgi:hypothetical protein
MHMLAQEWSGYAVKLLHEDGEFDLYRGHRVGDEPSVLLRVPLGDEPAPAALRRMEHEYELRATLDPTWAAQPITVQRRGPCSC